MLAAEFGGVDGGLAARPHTAADITHAAARRGMLLMGAGERACCKRGCCEQGLWEGFVAGGTRRVAWPSARA